MRTKALASGVVAVLGMAGVAFTIHKIDVRPVVAAPAVQYLPAGAIAAPPQLLEQYDKYDALLKQIDKMCQKKSMDNVADATICENVLIGEMRAQVRVGFQFDPASRSLAPIPSQPATPPQPQQIPPPSGVAPAKVPTAPSAPGR
jgi:hypothetical protein